MLEETLLYGIVLIAYVVLRPVYTRLIRRLLSLTKTDVDDKFFEAVEKPLWIGIFFLLLDALILSLNLSLTLHRLLLTLSVVSFTWAILRIGRTFIYDVLGRTRFLLTERKTRETALSVLSNIYVAIVLFISIMYILSLWGVSITPLLASAGFFGLVIGLALKDPFENLISGILLLADPPFRVGDWVEINEIKGEVKDIGLRNTKILTIDGNLVTLPNTYTINAIVKDYHLPNDIVRLTIRVGVSYDSDPNTVKEVLLNVVKRDPRVLKDPPPKVYFVEMGDYALIFEVWFWVKVRDRFDVLSDLNANIFYALKERGIEIPFPIRTVYLKNA